MTPKTLGDYAYVAGDPSCQLCGGSGGHVEPDAGFIFCNCIQLLAGDEDADHWARLAHTTTVDDGFIFYSEPANNAGIPAGTPFAIVYDMHDGQQVDRRKFALLACDACKPDETNFQNSSGFVSNLT